jgi:hypothetical protein
MFPLLQVASMDKEDKVYIKDLTVRTRRGYLCVRVMRKWIYDGNVPGGPVLYVGLVLADEEVCTILILSLAVPESRCHMQTQSVMYSF